MYTFLNLASYYFFALMWMLVSASERQYGGEDRLWIPYQVRFFLFKSLEHPLIEGKWPVQ